MWNERVDKKEDQGPNVSLMPILMTFMHLCHLMVCSAFQSVCLALGHEAHDTIHVSLHSLDSVISVIPVVIRRR
jgi:hypothetical protein